MYGNDLNVLKQIVLSSQDKSELLSTELTLVEAIAMFHSILNLSGSRTEKIEYKGYLSVANTLLVICRSRSEEISNKANRMNHNFRMAAKLMLKEDTYKAIWDRAQDFRGKVKEESAELRKNKLE